ncbi:hypothetical protein [Janibacter terrae]|uniref:hypothetical protein n=1 Tax=Janibacter terrae TaxID=103817 RepID=UPI0031F75780
MGSEQHVVWCSRCYNLNIAHPATETFLDGYLPCQFCSGTCLRLPDRFGKYAVLAFASLTQHEHAKGVPLAELGRVIGQARAQHAAGSGPDPVATITASAPELEDLLLCARDHDDLGVALLALWILTGELLVATRDPSIVEFADQEPDSVMHLKCLHHLITALS